MKLPQEAMAYLETEGAAIDRGVYDLLRMMAVDLFQNGWARSRRFIGDTDSVMLSVSPRKETVGGLEGVAFQGEISIGSNRTTVKLLIPVDQLKEYAPGGQWINPQSAARLVQSAPALYGGSMVC